MFADFKFQSVPLKDILLDYKNPRIVTPSLLTTQEEIISYFFEHEKLGDFLKKVALEGFNLGAERPYLIRSGNGYTVIEGNTRIATYKLIVGQFVAPPKYKNMVPAVSNDLKDQLLNIDCSIAPSRDALLPIMASAHFGTGDKTKWGYLGSRKAVYDEWLGGKKVSDLAQAFDRREGQIIDLILEYKLYLEALTFTWSATEKAKLLDPAVEFNPPIRFLQSQGHIGRIGMKLDRNNLSVEFVHPEGKGKYQHLIRKLVVTPQRGLGATASYDKVFDDYVFDDYKSATAPMPVVSISQPTGPGNGGASSSNLLVGMNPGNATSGPGSTSVGALAPPNTQPMSVNASPSSAATTSSSGNTLFSYYPRKNNTVHDQLMKEARKISITSFPAASTALLRAVVETVLKTIIDEQKANQQNKLLSLEIALDICLSNSVNMGPDDKRIIKEFKKSHLDYVNLGSHAVVIPNKSRLIAARDCIDQFVMRNI